MNVVDRDKATHVLCNVRARTSRDPTLASQGVYRIGKGSMPCFQVPVDDLVLHYVHTTMDARLMSPQVRRNISAMYSNIDDFDFSDPDGTRYLRRAFDVDRGLIIHARNIEVPKPNEFDRAKVTAEHHTHYRPEEIWEAAQSNKKKLRAMLLIVKHLRGVAGITEAAVSTFMAYVMFCRPQVAYLLATSRRVWAAQNVEELAQILKEISTPFKSVHNRDVLDMTELFEMACLVNRGIGKIDWDSERQHRLRPDVVKVQPQAVYDEAMKIFAEGAQKGFVYKKMDIDRYLSSRWEWVPSGSVHSQYSDDAAWIKKEYRHRTKFVTLNSMKKENLAAMFKRRPEIQAWASVKYEWAKQRAIYGVDLTSSVVTNYAMFRCEDVFKHHFPIGEEAAADRVHKRLNYMLKDSESFCYDFDDFNAQHSTASMKSVLMAYYDTFTGEMDNDQKSAMEWVIKSIDNVTVHNNEDGRKEEYKPRGTLLSGWRLTTFMNTALNYIYFKIAGALDLEGVVDSVHNGDDVLVSINNVKVANRIHSAMANINARAQTAKCNVFSVGEFLRVEHKVDKQNGLGAQYLTRGVATLVHSRVETQEPVRLTDAIKASVTRSEEIIQRADGHVEEALILLDRSVVRLAKLFGEDVGKCRRFVQAHAVVGGPIATYNGKVERLYEEKIEYDTTDDQRDSAEVATVEGLAPGIHDYATILYRQFGDYMGKDKILKSIRNATRRQLSITRRTWLTERDVSQDRKYQFGRAMFRMYRGLINMPHLEKARFVGLSPIGMLDSRSARLVCKLIGQVTDVDYALRVLL